MTAHRPTRSGSENSVPRRRAGAALTPDHDPRLQSIVAFANQRNGATTARTLASRCGWSLRETHDRLEQLRRENYVQLEQLRDGTVVLLTTRGEQLASEAGR